MTKMKTIVIIAIFAGALALGTNPVSLRVDAANTCKHEYQIKEVLEPTEEEEASILYECKSCGATKKEVIDHEDKWHYTDKEELHVDNCETAFYKLSCRFCGFTYYYHFETGKKHDYKKRSIVKATVSGIGVTDYTCKKCDYSFRKVVDKLTPKCTLSAKRKTIRKNHTYTLHVSMARGDEVKKYSSSNKKVAVVNKSGKIKALKKGKATITVTTLSGLKAKCKITVK